MGSGCPGDPEPLHISGIVDYQYGFSRWRTTFWAAFPPSTFAQRIELYHGSNPNI